MSHAPHPAKRIYVYSPSGAVRDKAAFKRGIARLEALGHAVEVDPGALAAHQRFAGDDATRLAAIHRAAASGADVALITRGGYGLTRILPGIRYKVVAKAIERGTCFVGLSDFTAFQNAVLAQTGAVTWAGPALVGDFGGEDAPDDIMAACFDDLLDGRGEGAGWRLGKSPKAPERKAPAPGLITGAGPMLASGSSCEDAPGNIDTTLASLSGPRGGRGKGAGQRSGKAPDAPEKIAKNLEMERTSAGFYTKPWTLRRATLWGGNLSILAGLLGTPYFPQAKTQTKGGVLFLEDVGEHPYRIERMLTQLLHAGVLATQKAIVLGQFTGYQRVPHDKGFTLQTVVDWLRAQLGPKTPVLTNLPFGHVPTKVLLPVGAPVTLTVEGREAFLLWGHLGHAHHSHAVW